MKKFKYLIFAGIVVLGSSAKSQDYFTDALIFSRTSHNYGNTARIQGLGGAQTSLGADMSSAASNPAGLGFFNRSVFSVSPTMNFHNTTSGFGNDNFGTYRNNFNIPNIGIALNTNKGDYTDEKFKAGTFAISFSRINDFNNEFYLEGDPSSLGNAYGSMIDNLINGAGAIQPEQLPEQEYAAYLTYLIDPLDPFTGYGSEVRGLPLSAESIRTSGAQNQLNISYGGNYDDKLYFGGSIGLTTLKYSVDRRYEEYEYLYQENDQDIIENQMSNAYFDDDLRVNGGGINATVGLIVRPIPFVTIGASYMTPTYYNLEEERSFVHAVNWIDRSVDGDDLGFESHPSDIFMNQYNLRTPGRINVGATLFMGKLGFVTGDVQFVDYGESFLRSSDFGTSGDNQTIQDLYRNTINFNVGTEFRLDNFRFRGGFAHYGDPFDDGDFYDESIRNITFGLGYRSKDYFVDIAVINSKSNHLMATYFPEVTGYSDTETETTTVSATVGFNF